MAGPLGSAPGIILGVGVGGAAAAALEPAIEVPRQKAWAESANRILDPGLLARLVAQGGIDLDAARAEAAREGYAADKMDALVYLAVTTPPVNEALTLWRRGLISDDLWTHVLVKSGIEARYYPSLNDLKTSEPLDPAVIATAIQRGIMHDPGFLPVGPPAGEGNVKAFPVSPLDTLAEAAESGVARERLFVQTAIVGLPLALVSAAQAYFRQIITLDDFKRAVAEGNTRNEWGDAALEVSRQILTSGQYAELQLRGYIDRAERLRLTGRHGMTTEDSDLLFNVLGRSIPVKQILTGEARGGTFEGPSDDIPPAYLQSLQRGNLRPEYYNLAYHNRYSYSVPFWLRALMQAGVFDEAESEQILLEVGNRPDIAHKVASFYTQGTTTVADKHVAKAQTQLWTSTHRAYVAGEIDQAEATVALTKAGVTADVVPQVIAAWDEEKALVRKQLSPASVKKLYATQEWTQDQAVARLVQMGFSAADAAEYLKT